MSAEPVCYELDGNIALIRLNRPENRNSMDGETLPAFQRALEKVKADPKIRCLVITGSGSSFCGGADFKSGVLDKGELPLNESLMAVYQPFLDVGKIRVPVIAAMNGHAVGGGLGLALMCDIRVAGSKAKYGANFARLGLHSGMAISYILPRLVGLARANELLFTGRIISGRTALDMGLVNYAVEADQVMEKAMELAREIAGAAPYAVRMMKQSILHGLDWAPEDAARQEAVIQSRTFEMEDSQEGIAALLEKRTAEFKGR
ncbi:MAG: enoyl-CoA hydratase/isomerase family protein [Desulfobacterales bacterium]|nr:enoyl-CoA hydratase/isomerase family protein [Desulfobacterales bacterium]